MKNRKSAVSFPTPTRVHLSLAVAEIGRSIRFYRDLFGQGPTKVRPGYAKFEVADPPVHLALEEAPPVGKESRLSHLGIQVKGTQEVFAYQERMAGAGHATRTEENAACCYAVQDKVWVTDPDGNPWEVFVTSEADHPARGSGADAGAVCCPS